VGILLLAENQAAAATDLEALAEALARRLPPAVEVRHPAAVGRLPRDGDVVPLAVRDAEAEVARLLADVQRELVRVVHEQLVVAVAGGVGEHRAGVALGGPGPEHDGDGPLGSVVPGLGAEEALGRVAEHCDLLPAVCGEVLVGPGLGPAVGEAVLLELQAVGMKANVVAADVGDGVVASEAHAEDEASLATVKGPPHVTSDLAGRQDTLEHSDASQASVLEGLVLVEPATVGILLLAENQAAAATDLEALAEALARRLPPAVEVRHPAAVGRLPRDGDVVPLAVRDAEAEVARLLADVQRELVRVVHEQLVVAVAGGVGEHRAGVALGGPGPEHDGDGPLGSVVPGLGAEEALGRVAEHCDLLPAVCGEVLVGLPARGAPASGRGLIAGDLRTVEVSAVKLALTVLASAHGTGVVKSLGAEDAGAGVHHAASALHGAARRSKLGAGNADLLVDVGADLVEQVADAAELGVAALKLVHGLHKRGGGAGHGAEAGQLGHHLVLERLGAHVLLVLVGLLHVGSGRLGLDALELGELGKQSLEKLQLVVASPLGLGERHRLTLVGGDRAAVLADSQVVEASVGADLGGRAALDVAGPPDSSLAVPDRLVAVVVALLGPSGLNAALMGGLASKLAEDGVEEGEDATAAVGLGVLTLLLGGSLKQSELLGNLDVSLRGLLLVAQAGDQAANVGDDCALLGTAAVATDAVVAIERNLGSAGSGGTAEVLLGHLRLGVDLGNLVLRIVSFGQLGLLVDLLLGLAFKLVLGLLGLKVLGLKVLGLQVQLIADVAIFRLGLVINRLCLFNISLILGDIVH